MSLETLLEAAKYLEYRSEAKARGEEPQDYPAFSRVNHNCPSSSGLSNKHSMCRSPDLNSAGTREVHNKLEKNRRAHLKECFEMLKKQLPSMDDRKTSNLSILRGALRCIQTLKRKERDFEHEMENLAREKIASQQKLAALKKELSSHMDHVDLANFLPEQDNETTTTASECGAYSDDEELTTSKKQASEALPRAGSPESASQSSSSSNSNSEGPSMLDTIAMAAATLAHSTGVSPAEAKSVNLPVIAVSSASVTTNEPSYVSSSSVTDKITATTVNVVNPFTTITTTPSMPSTGGTTLVTSNLPQLVGTSSTPIRFPSSASSKAISFANTSASHIHLSTQVGATNSLQLSRMAGVLATPHGVQLINQTSGGLKVLSSASATLNGPLHILSPAASSLVAMASASTLQSSSPGTMLKQNQTLVHVGTPTGKNGPSGVTLVASPTVVSMTQMKNASTGKHVILQHAPIASKAGSNKGPSTTTLALVPSANGTAQVNGITFGAGTAKGPILATPKSLQHSLVTGTPVTQPATTSVSTRQLVTSTLKAGQLRTTSIPQFSGMAQIVSQPQIMSVNSHMGPLVAPVSVVSNSSSMIRASASLGKVLAGTPLLKNVSSLPLGAGLLQQPTTILQPTNSVVKPMVVVSMAGSSTTGVVNIPISQ